MATNAKIDRALYGPSVLEVTLGAALSVLLGVLLAAVYLILKPVQTVKELPKEPASDVVYYLEGSSDSSKSRQLMRKRQMLIEGQPADIVVSEDELNVWIAGLNGKAAVPAAPAAPGKPAAAAAAPAALIVPGNPNFRIRESVMQIGLPATVNLLGLSQPVIFQSRGTFTKQGDMFVFTPAESLIGSLPVHRLPGVENFVIERIVSVHEIPEEMVAAWKKLSLVALEGNSLRLTLP